jgi:putative FmdB family regulatory protein
MPIYTYRCHTCNADKDIAHGMTEDGNFSCEICGGTLRKVYNSIGISFKGKGFYSTDSRGK